MQTSRIGQGRFTPVAYLSPALFSLALLSLVPVLWAIYISFTDYSLATFRNYHFSGIRNFKAMFSGPMGQLFLPVLVWNIIWALCAAGLGLVIGLFLALVLNNKFLWEAPLYRSLLIIPWAMPGAITTLIWRGMVNESFGPINVILKSIGLHGLPFLSNPLLARVTVIAVSLWFGFPYFMTACSGAIQAISHELYEAVDIDGGNWWASFRHVTMPGVWSVVAPLMISSFSYNFGQFNLVYLITGGGPPRLTTQYAGYTDILASVTFKLTADSKQYGLAAAMGIMLFLLIAVFSLYQVKLLAQEEVR